MEYISRHPDLELVELSLIHIYGNCMNRQRMNNPNKKYKELKQKQKARISDLMYRETDRFLQEKKDVYKRQD